MKRRVIFLALCLILILAGNVSAAVNALDVPRYVISSGGGYSAAGNYVLEGTIGQPVAGIVSTGSYNLCSGFWCGLGVFHNLLPIILKQ
ncbi:MAG: hypothetical protein HZB51_22440 [Chloroflexi bacterium]|nr:hypothetical protein [Chloroflexota bacterium]